jgi:uncharacterized protein
MKKVIVLFLLLSLPVLSQVLPERPVPAKLVNNLSVEVPNFITEDEAADLESKLEKFSRETSNQICIIIVDSLYGFSDADFGERILTSWGVGKKDKNNGIVIVIKPSGGKGERRVFIAPGYGLEGAIPDLTCKKIVDNELIPNFKNGDNYLALDKATNVLMALAKGEYNFKDYKGNDPFGQISIFWLIIIAVVVIIFLKRMFRGGGRTYSSRGGGFLGGFFMGGGFGGGSNWGGGSSGSSSGWGGFGGGSGGGGGAGGSW